MVEQLEPRKGSVPEVPLKEPETQEPLREQIEAQERKVWDLHGQLKDKIEQNIQILQSSGLKWSDDAAASIRKIEYKLEKNEYAENMDNESRAGLFAVGAGAGLMAALAAGIAYANGTVGGAGALAIPTLMAAAGYGLYQAERLRLLFTMNRQLEKHISAIEASENPDQKKAA